MGGGGGSIVLSKRMCSGVVVIELDFDQEFGAKC